MEKQKDKSKNKKDVLNPLPLDDKYGEWKKITEELEKTICRSTFMEELTRRISI